MKLKFSLINLIIGLVLLSAVNSHATQSNRIETLCSMKVCFPSTMEVEGKKLPLLGQGTFRFWGFKVYTAALYGPKGVRSPQDILSEVPKVLVLHYHRDLEAKDLINNTLSSIKLNPGIDLEEIASELSKINRTYRRVKEGDRYSISYKPGHGFTLSLNQVKLGKFTGKQFTRAYYGIWLSDYSVSRNLTRQLITSY